MTDPKVHLVQQPVADANIDLIAEIDAVSDSWAAWRLAGSYTWKIDQSINQIVSALFSTVSEKYAEANGIQLKSDIAALLAYETETADAFKACGFDTEGPITNLRNLVDLRDEAYELEKELCAFANPTVADIFNIRKDDMTGKEFAPLFKKPELDEMFLDFKPVVPNAGDRQRHSVEVMKLGNEHYEDAKDREQFVQDEMNAYDDQALRQAKIMNDGLARNAPIKQLILSEVQALEGIDSIDSTYELNTAVLRNLLTHMKFQAQRAKEWNAQRKVDTPLIKTLTNVELDKFARVMEASLRTPRFSEGVPFAPALRKPFRELVKS